MTREQLIGAIAALEDLPLSYDVADARVRYRAQLAALGPGPEQPWTDRERRLREALERLVSEEIPIKQPYELPKCRICNRSAFHEPDCPYAEAIKVLAEVPPPDLRDEALERAERLLEKLAREAKDAKVVVDNLFASPTDEIRNQITFGDVIEAAEVLAAIARAKGGQ